MTTTDFEASTFQKRPAYRYIRGSDRLPRPQELGENPVAAIKLFAPSGGWTWYIAAYDPETREAYGLVDGFEKEFGYVSMPELVAFRGRFGLPVERDLYWKPIPLDEIA